jgi:hypothetical protein
MARWQHLAATSKPDNTDKKEASTSKSDNFSIDQEFRSEKTAGKQDVEKGFNEQF